MLKLSRKYGESILITVPESNEARVIEIKVLKTGFQTLLGFNASKDIIVDRKEIFLRKFSNSEELIEALNHLSEK